MLTMESLQSFSPLKNPTPRATIAKIASHLASEVLISLKVDFLSMAVLREAAFYHSICDTGTGSVLIVTSVTLPLLTFIILSAIGVMALLCVIIITVVPEFLA